MSNKRDSLIYWDTCVFLAWIKQETCWPEDTTKGIEQTIEQVYAKRVVLVTSAVTLTEILQSKMKVEDKDRYRKVFGHPQVQLMDVDRRVSALAATIREFYDTRVIDPNGVVTSGSIMSLADALHLATAIHYQADEFQTIDGAGRRQRRTDLLRLSGNVAGARLLIVQPKYIAPLAALEGPLSPTIGGAQQALDLKPPEFTASADPVSTPVTSEDIRDEKQTESEPSPPDLRPSGDGSPKDQSRTEAAEEAEAEGADGSQA